MPERSKPFEPEPGFYQPEGKEGLQSDRAVFELLIKKARDAENLEEKNNRRDSVKKLISHGLMDRQYLLELLRSQNADKNTIKKWETSHLTITEILDDLIPLPVEKTEKNPKVIEIDSVILTTDEEPILGPGEKRGWERGTVPRNNLLIKMLDENGIKPDEYTIVGVISDNSTPLMYVPFINLRAMGITNFSQIKVNVDANENLLDVRKHIESSGYGTISVADTVVQINNLFANVRLLLSILGMVALSVASLGMFNTLTVSLLERTREVGLMKAMGMKSYEVRDLFLTESMIMGFFGGLIGLMFGMLIGKGVSIILSVFSVAKGVGFVDISFVPPIFVIAVVILSVLVGVFTGLYPAKRATKISALNALRYE